MYPQYPGIIQYGSAPPGDPPTLRPWVGITGMGTSIPAAGSVRCRLGRVRNVPAPDTTSRRSSSAKSVAASIQSRARLDICEIRHVLERTAESAAPNGSPGLSCATGTGPWRCRHAGRCPRWGRRHPRASERCKARGIGRLDGDGRHISGQGAMRPDITDSEPTIRDPRGMVFQPDKLRCVRHRQRVNPEGRKNRHGIGHDHGDASPAPARYRSMPRISDLRLPPCPIPAPWRDLMANPPGSCGRSRAGYEAAAARGPASGLSRGLSSASLRPTRASRITGRMPTSTMARAARAASS